MAQVACCVGEIAINPEVMKARGVSDDEFSSNRRRAGPRRHGSSARPYGLFRLRGLNNLMLRYHLTGIFLLIAALSGCHRPLHIVADGNVVASGKLATSLVQDHNACPVEPRSLSGNHCSPHDRIALVDVDGLLLNRNMTGLGSMGENPVALFQEKLRAIANDATIRAVVLRINSPGGGVTASDMMRRELEVFKLKTGLPVVACLMDVGTGGAYYLATAADVIVAHPTTITGGIGVIFNTYSLQDTMSQFNVLGLPIKAGEYVDLGSPIKGQTPQSRELLQHVADEFHKRFRDAVMFARKLESPPAEVFDGRIFTATDALKVRLIDEIGYLEDAVNMTCQINGLAPSADLVVYRRDNDRALSPYDISPNIPLQNSLLTVSLPGLDRSQLPTFLYLWQPEPLLERTGGN